MSALLGGSNHVMSIKIDGDDDKLLVLSMQGKEHMGSLPEWQLELVGNVSMLGVRKSIDLHGLLGKVATVTMELHGLKRYFKSYITEAQRGERHGRFEAFSITMRPWLWFATRSRNCRIFQNKAVDAIIKEVLKGYKGTIDWRLSGEYKPLEYCVQYMESDFDFVSRLMEEVGMYYFFEHTEFTHKLVVVDDLSQHEAKGDNVNIPWSHKLDGNEGIVEWSTTEETRPSKVSLRDYDYLATGTAINADASGNSDASVTMPGDGEVYEFTARAVQNQVKPDAQPATAALTHLAKVRMEELQSLHKVGTGTTNCMDVASGTTFKLKDAPHGADDDEYVIVDLDFHAEFADHEAIEDLKSIQQRRDGFLAHMVCIPKNGAPFRTARRTPRPVMYGPQTAVVVGASGNEIETDKHGRIKVQFHWDKLGKKDANSSCFLRVAQPWAGKGMGLWLLPRVGHEVVVSFIGGDPDRPIITGSVHNDVNIPIYPLPANADISGWRTHSTKGGDAAARHELRFDDKKDKEYIWLQSQKIFHRHVKDDAFDWIEKNETKKVKLTRKEVVGENWYVNVGKDVMHDLGKDLHIKVAGDIYTTGAATYQLQLTKDLSAKVGADMGFDVTGKTAIKAGGDINIQSGGAGNIKTTGNLVGEAGAKVSLKATSDIVMQGVNVKAKGSAEIVLEASAGIKIVCGASVITLGPAGVTIDGPLVKVNCGGGGGSAGAAESAAAAEPKAPKEALNQEELTSGKATDYDKLFADPLADNAGAAGAGGAGAAAGAGAGGGMLNAGALAKAGAASALAGAAGAAALAGAAVAVAAGGAAAAGVVQMLQAKDAEHDYEEMKDAEAEANAGEKKTAEEVLAEAEAAYAAAKAGEGPPLTEEQIQALKDKALAEADAAYAAAKAGEAPPLTEEEIQAAQDKALAEAEAAYAAAKAAEALPLTEEQIEAAKDQAIAEAEAAYAAAKAGEAPPMTEEQFQATVDKAVAEAEAAYEAAKKAEADAAAEAEKQAEQAAKDADGGGGSA